MRPLRRRSLWMRVGYGSRRDHKISRIEFKLLIISILIHICSPFSLSSQISNQSTFEKLVIDHLERDLRTINKLDGTTTPAIEQAVKIQSDGEFALTVEPPLIQYKNLDGPNFQRQIQTDIIFTDSTEHRSTVTWTDTLHRSKIPDARDTELKSLQGPDPRFRAVYLRPALGIGGGIALIISLFYIRSATQ